MRYRKSIKLYEQKKQDYQFMIALQSLLKILSKICFDLGNNLFVSPVYMSGRADAIAEATTYLYAIRINVEHGIWRYERVSNH